MADQNSRLDPDQQDAVDPEERSNEAAFQASRGLAQEAAADGQPFPDVMGLGEAQGMLEGRSEATNQTGARATSKIEDAAKKTGQAKVAEAEVNGELANALLPVFQDQKAAADLHAQAVARSTGLRQRAMDQLDHLDNVAAGLSNESIQNPFARMSTGQKLFAYLSQMFGAFTSGVMGGPNIPAQMIHDEIKQDIEIQRYNLLHGQQSVQNQQGILSSMLKVFGDMDTAEAAAYMATNDALKRRMDMIAAGYKQPQIIAAAKAAQAALEENGVDASAKLSTFFTGQRNDLAKAEADLSKAGATLEAANLRAKAAREAKQGVRVGNYVLPTNVPTQVSSKLLNDYGAVQELKQQVADYAEMQDKLGMLEGPEKVMRMRSALAGLVPILRQLFNTGANLTVNEQGNIEAQIPGVASFTAAPEQALARLADLVKRADSTMANRLKAANAAQVTDE